jgi:translation initiation factor IF-1
MANDTDMVYPGKVLAVLPNGHYKVKIKELDFEMQAYK